MLASRGMHLLFADADNATDIRCLDAVLQALEETSARGLGFVVGSRNTHSADTVSKVGLT
jgi:hypothetical protein